MIKMKVHAHCREESPPLICIEWQKSKSELPQVQVWDIYTGSLSLCLIECFYCDLILKTLHVLNGAHSFSFSTESVDKCVKQY